MSDISNTEQRVVCAANRNTVTNQIICGARHFDQIMHHQMEASGRDDWRYSEQGFIDQHGKFLTREQAWEVAEKSGQILFCQDWLRGSLHSEHLY